MVEILGALTLENSTKDPCFVIFYTFILPRILLHSGGNNNKIQLTCPEVWAAATLKV